MTAFPNNWRTELQGQTTFIKSLLTVSSSKTWKGMAAGANWLNGTGAMLVPCTPVLSDMTGTNFLHFQFTTRQQAIARLWTISFFAATDGMTAGLTVNGYSTGPQSVSTPSFARPPLTLIEPLSSQGIGDVQIIAQIDSSDQVTISQISCSELWRPSLNEDFVDGGTNDPSCGPSERIYVGPDLSPKSVAACYRHAIESDPRRVGIYTWCTPEANPWTRTGTAQSLLVVPMPVLMRKILTGASTGEVLWSAFCKVSAGTGKIVLTTSQSGVADSVNVTGTSYFWTDPRPIEISCEDMNANDGLQSSTFDELDITGECAGGTISIVSVAVWESVDLTGAAILVTDTGDYFVTDTGEIIVAP